MIQLLPYDSFLIDGPWLFGIGWVLGKLLNKYVADQEKNQKARRFLSITTIAIFWITSVSLYLNLEWTRWIWEMCRAESGRDWMINSGVFHFDHENVSAKGHLIGALIFLTYPLWLKAGFSFADKGKEQSL